jgi:hypothetical protein
MKDLIASGSKPIGTLFRSLAAGTALVLSAAIVLPGASFADENGVSFWLPGLFGSLAAVPQHPGWQVTAIDYFDSVSASGAAAAAREITIGKLSPTVNTEQVYKPDILAEHHPHHSNRVFHRHAFATGIA